MLYTEVRSSFQINLLKWIFNMGPQLARAQKRTNAKSRQANLQYTARSVSGNRKAFPTLQLAVREFIKLIIPRIFP